ncbi:hypothetical protein CH63R_14302 [Colletotrichum higginsianum IMI 349063]|uniref:Uncharacterized protein n=1 Tax=Colletotrichum higginsianum (strain IMI 349063) TaxID=759273 RepID=A0A1B7XTJ5_COLHI|nr:hypothetical protein CH63R_14302 [Colletotrichum higginsianum IMI 349063]OBR03076.1 hypothetical protein CH63R_14302 [Colletotrichum higginsianum IMI 349063]
MGFSTSESIGLNLRVIWIASRPILPHPLPRLESFSVRVTSICLSSDFRKSKVSVVDAIGELGRLIQNGDSTARKLLKSSTKICGFFIISEEIVAWMVKDIMVRHSAVQPQNILGLVFLESRQPLEGVRREIWSQIKPVNEGPLEEIDAEFEVNFTQPKRGSNLQPVTWALEKSCLAEVDDSRAIWLDLLRFSISPHTKKRRTTILSSGNAQGGRWAIQEDLATVEIRSRHPALELYWDRQSQSKYQRGLVQPANWASDEGSRPILPDPPLPVSIVEGYEKDPAIPRYWLQDLEDGLVECSTDRNIMPIQTNSLKRPQIDSPAHSPGDGTATISSDLINATLLMI